MKFLFRREYYSLLELGIISHPVTNDPTHDAQLAHYLPLLLTCNIYNQRGKRRDILWRNILQFLFDDAGGAEEVKRQTLITLIKYLSYVKLQIKLKYVFVRWWSRLWNPGFINWERKFHTVLCVSCVFNNSWTDGGLFLYKTLTSKN